MSEMGLIGRKVGMTQIFEENGDVIPVTVIETGPCYVTHVKKVAQDGYSAVQLGYGEISEGKLSKPEIGHFKKNNLPCTKLLKELRLENDNAVENFKVGQKITVEIFKDCKYVDICGTSIGKGFQGVVRRHGFHGGPGSHGSMSHRAPGSIGSTTPARVLKGKKMAGHMGNRRVTTQNLKIAKIIPEKNLLLIRGSVPGAGNGFLMIKGALKKVCKGTIGK